MEQLHRKGELEVTVLIVKLGSFPTEWFLLGLICFDLFFGLLFINDDDGDGYR